MGKALTGILLGTAGLIVAGIGSHLYTNRSSHVDNRPAIEWTTKELETYENKRDAGALVFGLGLAGIMVALSPACYRRETDYST